MAPLALLELEEHRHRESSPVEREDADGGTLDLDTLDLEHPERMTDGSFLALQRTAGNAAVTGLIARSANGAMLQRSCGCGGSCCQTSSEEDELARLLRPHAATATIARDGGAQGILEQLPQEPIFSSPADFCRPYGVLEYPYAEQVRERLLATLPAAALAMFGSTDVAELWVAFLTPGRSSRRIFADSESEVVRAFASNPITAQFQETVVLPRVIEALRGSPRELLPGVETPIPVEELLSDTSLDINYSNPFDIPGHIAGGVSGSDFGPDTRNVRGDVLVTREVDGSGQTTNIVIRTDFEFVVTDAVDFCPGGQGSGLEQNLTIPLSRLEATGSFFASDVPFEARFRPPPVERRLGPTFPHTPVEGTDLRQEGEARQAAPAAPVE